MKKWFMVLLALIVVFSLTACTTKETTGESGEKVLYLNNGTEPTSFDPPIGFNASSWNALNNIMEGLTRLDQNHQPSAATAESWNISDDGTVYTFHIRDNAKWSNGDDVTAYDFEYAWKRMLNPETGSPAAFLAYFIKGSKEYNNGEGSADAVGVIAVDEKTLQVTLNAPTGFFLNIISLPAFFPINKAVAEDNPKWFAEAETFVGNGPFNLTEWKHDTEMVMTKNTYYWDAATVKLDKIHWAMINNSNTEYQMYQSGTLDTSGLPVDMAEQLLKSDEVKIEDQAGTMFFRFNVTKEPFQNKKIRKAFALAVDQQQIVEFVTKNREKSAHGFVSPGFLDPLGKDFRDVNGDLVKFNADEAKALLAAGMKEEGYNKLPEVTLSYNTSDVSKSIAETLQQMFQQNLGVEVKLENAEWNVFLQDQKDLKHQLSRSSFLADYGDPINYLESFISNSSMNRTGWKNDEYDELIASAKAASEEAQRWEYMYKAEQLLFEEMPIFPVYFYNEVNLEKSNVTGIVRHPVGYLELKWANKN